MKNIKWNELVAAANNARYLYWDTQLFYLTEDTDPEQSFLRLQTTGSNQTKVTIELHAKDNKQVQVNGEFITVKAYVSWEDQDAEQATDEDIMLLNPVKLETDTDGA